MGFYQSVYGIVRMIPQGKVASYSGVALLAGNPRAARAVGYALHKNPLPGVIPCHRVVNCKGALAPSFAFGGEEVQRSLLEKEGVVFLKDGFVDMKKCGWSGEDLSRPEKTENAPGKSADCGEADFWK